MNETYEEMHQRYLLDDLLSFIDSNWTPFLEKHFPGKFVQRNSILDNCQ